MRRLLSFGRNQNGTTTIMFAIGSVMLFGAAGVAITMGQVNTDREHLQAALDAAVIAGMATASTDPLDKIATAETVFSTRWKNSAVSKAVANAQPQFNFVGDNLRGEALIAIDGTLTPLVGADTVQVKAVAEASFGRSAPICVLALAPADSDALLLDHDAQFEARNCAVQANSSAAESLLIKDDHSHAVATAFYSLGKASGGGWSPTPVDGTLPSDDPLAGLALPAGTGCTATNLVLSGADTTLAPGTYCGGVVISNQSDIQLQAGIYVFKNGPLIIKDESQVAGERVHLHFLGANSRFSIDDASIVTLTSPDSGNYKNIQFSSDRALDQSNNNKERSEVADDSTLSFDGVMYLPEQDVRFSGSDEDLGITGSAPGIALIANTLQLEGEVKVTISREDKRSIGGEDQVITAAVMLHLVE